MNGKKAKFIRKLAKELGLSKQQARFLKKRSEKEWVASGRGKNGVSYADQRDD